MAEPAVARVDSLDLIRGIAVLGILAINIAGFAGPSAAVLTPDIPVAASAVDKLAYAVSFVVFEGKMRGLFSLLFGASLALFIDQADDSGRHGEFLQLKRLAWLTVFGALHYYLLWWGDILFTYGVLGIVALMMRELPSRTLAKIAIGLLVLWHLGQMAQTLPDILGDEAVRTGTAPAAQASDHAAYLASVAAESRRELAAISGSWPFEVADKWRSDPFRPIVGAVQALGETLPLMLLGMVLYASGFFSSGWPKENIRKLAVWATLAGLALTLALLAWVWPRDFPVRTMAAVLIAWTGVPHLLMTLGYAAILVLASPAIGGSPLGTALRACGRLAFTNYIGTSLLMTFVFNGWGLGLAGRYGHFAMWQFVLLGWAAMIGLSLVWLVKFRRGPLEWLWRSLVERTMLPNRR